MADYCRLSKLGEVHGSNGECLYAVFEVVDCSTQTPGTVEDPCDAAVGGDDCNNPGENCAQFLRATHQRFRVPTIGTACCFVTVLLKKEQVGDVHWKDGYHYLVTFSHQGKPRRAAVRVFRCQDRAGISHRVAMGIEVSDTEHERVCEAKIVITFPDADRKNFVQVGFETCEGEWAFFVVRLSSES